MRAAVISDGDARSVPTPDGTGEVPASVSFTDGTLHIGRSALGFGVTAPGATVRGVKRWLGLRGADPAVLRLSAESGVRAQVRSDGSLHLDLGGESRRPLDVAVALCKHVLTLAERHATAPRGWPQ